MVQFYFIINCDMFRKKHQAFFPCFSKHTRLFFHCHFFHQAFFLRTIKNLLLHFYFSVLIYFSGYDKIKLQKKVKFQKCFIKFNQLVYMFLNFVYLGFYVAFNTVQVISRRVVGRAEETRIFFSLLHHQYQI